MPTDKAMKAAREWERSRHKAAALLCQILGYGAEGEAHKFNVRAVAAILDAFAAEREAEVRLDEHLRTCAWCQEEMKRCTRGAELTRKTEGK